MFLYSLVIFWMKYLRLKLPINGDKGLSENVFIIWCINPSSLFSSICLLFETFSLILIYWIIIFIGNCAFDYLCLKLLVDSRGSKSLLL